MRSVPTSSLAFAIFAATACCGGTVLGGRNGPPFPEAFPDPAVLVTTADLADVRARLADVQLPATRQHHEALLALLRAQTKISAGHLLLLVEAVALPENTFISTGNGRRRAYAPRGQGQFAPVADQLLSEGASKLVDVDRRTLGELLGRTQGDAALKTLADRFVPALDDGSAAALRELVEGMHGSPATIPFLVGHLAPQGRLDGERGWSCVEQLAFDSERVALIAALGERAPPIAPERLAAMVKTMSFDDGRGQVVRSLASKCTPVPGNVAREVAASFSFDDGRQAACACLADAGAVDLDARELVALARSFSFDDGRSRCVRSLAPRLRGEVDGRSMKELLDSFSFDDGRLGALKTLASRCRSLPGADKQALLDAFSFTSNREAAARVLD